MTRTVIRWSRIALAGALTLACLFGNDTILVTGSNSLLSSAQARIGRPLTPMSYAGVARRTTRRAYGYGALGVGAVGVGAAVYGSQYGYGAYDSDCYQTVDVYGRIYPQC
jgi:hypothetical protein